jgi:RNA polymerase sigma factor (sigma-70 family)
VRKNSVGGTSLGPLVEKIAGDSIGPYRRVQQREGLRRMQAALASLPDEQREVIHRRYMQEESFEQIAAAMDRTRDGVRGLCYRARKNLRALMGGSSLYFSG